jgi:hypothetical protein
MALIMALPTELIQQICEHLDKDSVLSLRRTCQDMKSKTHYAFTKLFSSVKISFCLFSIQALDSISKDKTIASRVLHITIGTETLDQYKCATCEDAEQDEAHLTNYVKLCQADRDTNDTMLQMIHDICLRLPKLESLGLEDRPLDGTYTSHCRGMGSLEMVHQTGIELRTGMPRNLQRARKLARKMARGLDDSRKFVILKTLEQLYSLKEAGTGLRLVNELRGSLGRMYGAWQVERGDDVGLVLGKGRCAAGRVT